jgi:uncharacterized protein YoxC
MSPLSILLLVLAVAGIWAVVELALTLRKARTTLDEVSHSATEAMDQATPVIAKLDGVVDELQPALREVTPLVEKIEDTLDEANTGLGKVNNILGDVSSATHGVSSVGESASRIIDTATSAAVGVVSKVASFGGITIPEGQQLIGKGTPEAEAEAEPEAGKAEEQPAHKGGYVTYAPVTPESNEE